MKLSLKLIGLAAVALSEPAMAQTGSATASSSATATVIQTLSLSKTTDLAFGSFVRPTTGANNVVIDSASGARTLVGGGNATLAASTTSRAAFSVSGAGAQTFSISVPSTVTISRSGGAETLPVTLTPSATTGTLSGASGGNGAATFGVGGSLPVDSTVVGGSYTGAFDVTVGYN